MGVIITPMALAHHLHPIKTGRGISNETCGLDDVFPHDDIGSGSHTPFIIYTPYIIAALPSNSNKLLYTYTYIYIHVYIPKVDEAMTECWMIWYRYSFMFGFKCFFFQLYIVQDSLYHYMDIGTMWHCALLSCPPPPPPPSQSIGLVSWCALFWCGVPLCVPLTISLIKFYFHHDFHHDSCDYHWDFYYHSFHFEPHI